VAFVETNDVGNNPAVFALWIHEDLSFSGPWEKSPGGTAGILASAVIHIARLAVGNFGLLKSNPLTKHVLLASG
jgi:hypothetical protein